MKLNRKRVIAATALAATCAIATTLPSGPVAVAAPGGPSGQCDAGMVCFWSQPNRHGTFQQQPANDSRDYCRVRSWAARSYWNRSNQNQIGWSGNSDSKCHGSSTVLYGPSSSHPLGGQGNYYIVGLTHT